MRKINLIMPFSRAHLKDELIKFYEPMDIIIHQIMYESEPYVDFKRDFVRPYFFPGEPLGPPFNVTLCLINLFLQKHDFSDDDFYCTAPDDDAFAPGVLESIKLMDSDIVIISMDRGPITECVRNLIATPAFMYVGFVGGEQAFIKGKIFKDLRFDETADCADGRMIESLKEKYEFRYEPDLWALFNYFNPEWWPERS